MSVTGDWDAGGDWESGGEWDDPLVSPGAVIVVAVQPLVTVVEVQAL